MVDDDEIVLNITATQTVDSMRPELYSDRDAAGSAGIMAALKKITSDHRGGYEQKVSVPRGTRKGDATTLTEITRLLEHFHLWVATGGVSALLLQLKPLLEKWIDNRAGRTVRIKVGDIEVEAKGQGGFDVDKVLALVDRLKEKHSKTIIEP